MKSNRVRLFQSIYQNYQREDAPLNELALRKTFRIDERLKIVGRTAILTLIFFCFSLAGAAQTTDFTYQGRLTDGAAAASGNYQMKFSLYDQQGVQIGQTVENQTVAVNNGIFTVELNFGTNAFTGEQRFLEISVRRGAAEAYVALTPRQRVTSAPYAVKSLNANQAQTSVDSTQLGGIEANQYTQTTDARLSDDRNPKAGSGNYIQNTTQPQTVSNFNISGEGRANILSAATQFNIGSDRVLSSPGTSNIFVGVGAGAGNTSGFRNVFVGADAGRGNTEGRGGVFIGFEAGYDSTTPELNTFVGGSAGRYTTTGKWNTFIGGQAGFYNKTGAYNTFVGNFTGGENTTGSSNAFFGLDTGRNNKTGNNNAYFGTSAGKMNSSNSFNSFFGNEAGFNNAANANAFFGSAAGRENTTGANNSFFGADAGRANTTGYANSFFGTTVGTVNTVGSGNAFFGSFSGNANTDGNNNAFFGLSAGRTNIGGNFNSFFGSEAGFSNQSANTNSFFGSAAGRSTTTGASNAFFGTDAGRLNETGQGNSFIGTFSGLNNNTGTLNTFVGINAGNINTSGGNNTMLGANANVGGGNLFFATAIGANATASTSNTIVLGRANGADKVRVFGLGTGGTTPLCRNANNEISTCAPNFGGAGGKDQAMQLFEIMQTQKKEIAAQAERIRQQTEQIELLKQIVCAQAGNQAVCRKLTEAKIND